MANELALQPGERILREDPDVVWRKSWLSRLSGRLVFTTQRLCFAIARPPAFNAGQFIANEVRNFTPIDIPRDALAGVERGKVRNNDNVLVVKTEDETFQLILLHTPYKDWEATLRQAMHDDKVALEHVLDRLKPKDRPPPYR